MCMSLVPACIDGGGGPQYQSACPLIARFTDVILLNVSPIAEAIVPNVCNGLGEIRKFLSD